MRGCARPVIVAHHLERPAHSPAGFPRGGNDMGQKPSTLNAAPTDAALCVIQMPSRVRSAQHAAWHGWVIHLHTSLQMHSRSSIIPGAFLLLHSWRIPVAFLVHSSYNPGAFLAHSLCIPVTFLVHSWSIPFAFPLHSCYISSPSLANSYSIPVAFLWHSCSMPGAFLMHYWRIPGAFLAHSWDIPDTFLVHS